MKNKILIQRYSAPCGDLWLGSLEDRLCLCNWNVEKHPDRVNRRLQRLLHAEFVEAPSDLTRETTRQLDEYFRRERRTFDLPLLFAGTEFQKQVWQKLQEIPYGQTLSYGELATRIGQPTAVRATANANGANALSIIVPCHRIIGSDCSLTGYGGGINAKKFLLELEKE